MITNVTGPLHLGPPTRLPGQASRATLRPSTGICCATFEQCRSKAKGKTVKAGAARSGSGGKARSSGSWSDSTYDKGSPPRALSVIMPCRNVASTVADQLDALLGQQTSVSLEIIAVDNGSSDTTLRLLNEYAIRDSRLRVVRADERTGASYARNMGARMAKYSALAFVDADDLVAVGWLEAMGTALAEHPFVVGALELERLNPVWLARSRGFESLGAVGQFHHAFPYAVSGNMGIRRSLWVQLRGFDEDLTAAEDIELSLRAHQAGVELCYQPDAVVHYRYRATFSSRAQQAVAYGLGRASVLQALRRQEATNPVFTMRALLQFIRTSPALVSRQGRAAWLWRGGVALGYVFGRIRLSHPRLAGAVCAVRGPHLRQGLPLVIALLASIHRWGRWR